MHEFERVHDTTEMQAARNDDCHVKALVTGAEYIESEGDQSFRHLFESAARNGQWRHREVETLVAYSIAPSRFIIAMQPIQPRDIIIRCNFQPCKMSPWHMKTRELRPKVAHSNVRIFRPEGDANFGLTMRVMDSRPRHDVCK